MSPSFRKLLRASAVVCAAAVVLTASAHTLADQGRPYAIGDACLVLLRTGLLAWVASWLDRAAAGHRRRDLGLVFASAAAWCAAAGLPIGLVVLFTPYSIAGFLIMADVPGYVIARFFAVIPMYELPSVVFLQAAAVAAFFAFALPGRKPARVRLGAAWLIFIGVYFAVDVIGLPNFGPVKWRLVSSRAETRAEALVRLGGLEEAKKVEAGRFLIDVLAAPRPELQPSDEVFHRAFVKIGPPIVPALIESFARPQTAALEYTVRAALVEMGLYSAPALVKALPIEYPEMRALVVRALSEIKEEDRRPALAGEHRAAVAVLAAAVRSHDRNEIRSACTGLELLGPAAADAVPVLVAYLGTKYGGEDECYLALAAIGPAAKPAIPALMKILKGGGSYPGSVAVTLRAVGADVENHVVPVLLGLIKNAAPGQNTAPWVSALERLGHRAR